MLLGDKIKYERRSYLILSYTGDINAYLLCTEMDAKYNCLTVSKKKNIAKNIGEREKEQTLC